MNTFAHIFRRLINVVDPYPNKCITLTTARTKTLADWGRRACDELDDLHICVQSHMKGEGVKVICRSCSKNFWHVDDQPIVCPFCECEDMPILSESERK